MQIWNVKEPCRYLDINVHLVGVIFNEEIFLKNSTDRPGACGGCLCELVTAYAFLDLRVELVGRAYLLTKSVLQVLSRPEVLRFKHAAVHKLCNCLHFFVDGFRDSPGDRSS